MVLSKNTFRNVAVTNDCIEALQAEAKVWGQVCDDADVTNKRDQAADDFRVLDEQIKIKTVNDFCEDLANSE